MRAARWGFVVVAAGAVAAGPSAARAETETLEGQERELGLGSRLEVSPGALGWSAFAQVVGAGAAGVASSERHVEGAAAVGAELRVVSERCELVRVGGQARLAWSGRARPGAEQWASGCLALDFFAIEAGHHLEWDVRPSLLAPIQLRAGLNRRETVRLGFEPLRLPLSALLSAEEPPPPSPASFVLFTLDVEIMLLWSATTPLAWHQQPEAIAIRYEREQRAPWGERRDFAVNVAAGGGEFTADASSVHVAIVRIDNLVLGSALASGGIGFSSASAGPVGDDGVRQVALTTPLATLGLEAGGPALRGHLRAQHGARITPDDLAVVDTRLTGGLALDAAGARASLEGFVGQTALHGPDLAPVRGVTGGASAALALGLGERLEATLQLEAARSFYAADPGATAGALAAPRWGVNAMAALQATTGRAPRLRAALAPRDARLAASR